MKQAAVYKALMKHKTCGAKPHVVAGKTVSCIDMVLDELDLSYSGTKGLTHSGEMRKQRRLIES